MKQEFQHMGAALVHPEKVDSNIYDPSKVQGRSLENINGHLDHENVDYNDGHIPLQAIRPGALFRGKMVGSTLNADFSVKKYGGTSEAHYAMKPKDDWRAVEGIPGAGIEIYTPTSGTLLLTWQVGYESDLDKSGSLSPYEKRRGMAIAKAMAKRKKKV